MMYFHRKENTCNKKYFNYGSEFKSSIVTAGLMLTCQIIIGFLLFTSVGPPESCYFSCILPKHHFTSESCHQFLSLPFIAENEKIIHMHCNSDCTIITL